MIIEYPSLVEQAYNHAIKAGYKVSKADIYKTLVKHGIITETAEPTEQAIKDGLIYKTTDLDEIKKFKASYPAFKNIPDEYFSVKNGEVIVLKEGARKMAETVINDQHATEEQQERAQNVLNWLRDV